MRSEIQRNGLSLFLALLIVHPTAAEERAARCADTAAQVLVWFDEVDSDNLRWLFGENVSADPRYLDTWLRVATREYGFPNETKPDRSLNPSLFTELAVVSRGIDPPYEQIAFRTHFSREGEGAILLEMSPDSDCKINKLVLGIPRSREDALRRFYEINNQINYALSELTTAWHPKHRKSCDRLGRIELEVPIHVVEPVYPVEARARGIEGSVELELELDSAGHVSNAVVIESTPNGVFDAVALEAVRQWKYCPESSGSATYPDRLLTRLRFRP